MKSSELISSSRLGRIILHAGCAIRRPSHWHWHWQGIQREFLVWATLQWVSGEVTETPPKLHTIDTGGATLPRRFYRLMLQP
jgi:hypothetical protein